LAIELSQLQVGYLTKSEMNMRVLAYDIEARWCNFIRYLEAVNLEFLHRTNATIQVVSVEAQPFYFGIMERRPVTKNLGHTLDA
jgi:hypothetical protein